MAQYGVRTAQLRDVAETLAAAAEALRGVVEHPGIVRGRAQDSGDDGVRDAAERLADRWEHAMQLMAAESQRLVDVLRLAADTYDEADAVVAAVFATAAGTLNAGTG